jgi:uncharacterized lipoprotein YddW (UPF0748 family)
MRAADAIIWPRRALVALAVLCGVWIAAARTHADGIPEVRALWVLRSSLTSPAAIATLVKTAHDHGFNTLLVQVRGRGDAYYSSALEPRAADLARQPASFDPLAATLDEAHAAGLRVHAWINVALISSAVELPAAREHLVYEHPEWLMVPRAIAQDLAQVEPSSPAYIGKLARWTRGELDAVEGLYASLLLPNAASHAEAVIADVAKRYAVDGIHLDYLRYPNEQFDYSRFAIAQFRAEIRPHLDAATRRELDERESVDLFAYPDRFPDDWRAFRRTRLSALMLRLRTAVRTARPSALVTAAVAPEAQDAFDHRLQDWRGWVEGGLVDAICPMAYTTDAVRFTQQIEEVRRIAGARAVWAGIGSYRLTPEQTVDNILTARRLGAAGFVLFSYDSLTGPRQSAADYLAAVARGVGATSRSTDSSAR